MEIRKYMAKGVFEAIQFVGEAANKEILDFIETPHYRLNVGKDGVSGFSFEGASNAGGGRYDTITVPKTGWLIKNENREFVVCTNDKFEQTFLPVDDAPSLLREKKAGYVFTRKEMQSIRDRAEDLGNGGEIKGCLDSKILKKMFLQLARTATAIDAMLAWSESASV